MPTDPQPVASATPVAAPPVHATAAVVDSTDAGVDPPIDGGLAGEPAPRASLYSELKRRQIFSVALYYLIIATGLLHALDVIIPALGLPAWLMPSFIGGAIVGLPFAITLAWLFELEPEGLRHEHAADYVGFVEPPSRWPRLLLIVGVAIALAIVSLGAWLRFGPQS